MYSTVFTVKQLGALIIARIQYNPKYRRFSMKSFSWEKFEARSDHLEKSDASIVFHPFIIHC